MKLFLIAAFTVAVCFSQGSCEPESGEDKITVTFDSNGGSAVPGQTVAPDGRAQRPHEEPIKDGYAFMNWYSDSELTTIYNFSTKLTDSITLYALWDKIVPGISITLDKNALFLTVNATERLTQTVQGTANTNVTWYSGNDAVATVNDGTVTAVGVGTTLITVNTATGGKKAACTVTVREAGTSGERVVTYPWPEGMDKYSGITMTAGGQDIDLYAVRANNTHRWSTSAQENCDLVPVGMFDMEGQVSISITLNSAPQRVTIRPVGKNITAQTSGSTVTFTIPGPGQYSFEYGDPSKDVSQDGPIEKDAVLIFANPIEDFSAIENVTTTIVKEAGIHQGDETVGERYTLYLKPGAVIRGGIRLNSNAKIVGRGVIDGSHLDNYNRPGSGTKLPIETMSANNIEISGITIFDSNAWNIQLQSTSDITIDNLKIVSSRCNSDGISFQNSNRATITNSFIRTWDDGVVIKNYSGNASYGITVKNSIFWTDLAQCMEIGVETNKGSRPNPKIYDILFEDITVFHALHKAPISIHNGDNAEVTNITWRNITVEHYDAGLGDGWNYLIDITNLTGQAMGGAAGWTKVKERGNIRDVLIENVRVLSGRSPERKPGARFSSREGGVINNVTVKDIFYENAPLDLSSGVAANSNAAITFR